MKIYKNTNPIEYNATSDNVLCAREYRRLSQIELANKAEMSQERLSRFEKNAIQITVKELKMISKVLDFPYDFFTKPSIRIPIDHISVNQSL